MSFDADLYKRTLRMMGDNRLDEEALAIKEQADKKIKESWNAIDKPTQRISLRNQAEELQEKLNLVYEEIASRIPK